MLQELSIRNFAIIDKISISFSEGLTVLTGETGAGKSIIIDAVHLLVGGRGSAEFVRHGEKKAEIEGLFFIHDEHSCIKKASEYGIDVEEGMVVLRREISNTGKSVCRVNGKLVTIATMREIGSSLIDIHGQHEHQELMNDALHVLLLDQYGKKEIVPARERYTNVYEKYLEVQNKIKELSKTEQQMAHRLDLLQFQMREIEKANLKMNEDDLLEEERKRLVNFEKLFGSLKDGYEQLQGDQRGLDSIGRAMSMLETAAEVDSKYQSIKESVSNSYYMLEDAVLTIRTELDMLEYDPMRLNEIESRLNEINQLKRKYGYTVEQILDYYEKIKEETESILNKESRLEELQKQLDKLKKQLMDIGNHLTKIRKKWANKLTNAIHRELKELYMDKTVFEVTFNEQLPSGNGLDNIQFYISTNPGEPLKPLSKVASGGELSRIMLALKTIFSTRVTSVIFDEVDTGVSGRVAQAMAEKMYKISVNSQVLCISHLPQVAAMADHHMLIAKEIIHKRTRTTIKNLTEKEKIKEIGRMISGTEITDITKRHAKELLQSAYTIKKP
ncbi:DNA repair protein RecN [Siminovitchia sp. FSL H7-0308]|uniref:DNA repair protein RecN n=1 Tax=Siminovitchia thermophila TaxID=1245522 RepID=A0ABS2R4C8_9BACI|nr:DNA repair protein RecN [Siminovitchia thermophila]MBM7713758.1 DNA repair protein RecN (Recombination protein N) [Siminovitchia thermophila]ONK23632.1 DNA repair protein RecN [Bacillus sp. VT-16-64]